MAIAANAQSTQLPSFEVATVKPAAPGMAGGRASFSGDRVTFNNTTLLNALTRAFQLKFASQVAGPAWIFTERYEIAAKAPENTSKDKIILMLQALLIERFQLVLHHETRELPGYALVLGKGRLELVESHGDSKSEVVVTGGHRQMKNTDMTTLAQFASQTLRAPVMDMTGLTGYYDFPYDFSMEETGGMTTRPEGGDPANTAPSIFTIVESLGLKLESRKMAFDVIVIDGGNKTPIGN
ncbi:MAG TPA: TIGR03435 family protein [Bryobacteraceae bacterium]|nr:TIGR03435 family protein [Bryobacteraceae bacterium]